MALLNIKPAVWPVDATHIGQSGEVIKDLGESFLVDGGKERKEIYYVWLRGEWVPKFGRHLAKIALGAEYGK